MDSKGKSPQELSMIELIFNLMKVTLAEQFKQLGNQYFKEKNYQKALGQYHKVFTHLNGLVDDSFEYYQMIQNDQKKITDEETKQLIKTIKATTHLNMAQIYINQEKYEKGLKSSSESLKMKESAKGFYRQGICNMKLNNLDQAKECFKKTLDLDSSIEGEIKKYLSQIAQQEKKYDNELAKKMQKMWI